MTEAWRLDHGTLGGSFALGTVAVFVPFGTELRLTTPAGGALLRLDLNKVTQDIADGGATMHFTGPEYRIDAMLTKVDVQISDTGWAAQPAVWQPVAGATPPVVVRTYTAKSQALAAQQMTADAAGLATNGYYPASQSWADGSYGCGEFLVALVLCFLLVGFLIFVYMLIVKPDGTLTVTYQLRESPAPEPDVPPAAVSPADTKVCPRCAETIKAAALVCRYCGHEFEAPAPPTPAADGPDAPAS